MARLVQRRLEGVAHQAMQDALAQTAIGDPQHRSAGQRAQDRLQDRAAGDHQIGAPGPDAGMRRAVGIGHGAQPLRGTGDRGAVEHQPVDPPAIVAAQVQVERRERGDRAGRADQLRRRPPRAGAPAPTPPRSRRAHDRTMASKVDASGSEVNASDSATTPIGRGHAGEPRPSAGRAAVEPQDLGAAAADVDQQGRSGAGLDQRQTSEQRQLRLLLVRQDLELDPGGAPDPGQELGAVAARAGRPRSRRSGPARTLWRAMIRAHTLSAATVRAIARSLEPAARRQPFAEAHDPREAVDHLEAVGVRPGDQQTAVIGPQVEGSQRRHPRVSAYWTVSVGQA